MRAAAGGTLDHPASDPFWHRGRKLSTYRNATGTLGSVTLRRQPSGTVGVELRSRHATIGDLGSAELEPRLRIGDQCFAADLAGRCRPAARGLRCR